MERGDISNLARKMGLGWNLGNTLDALTRGPNTGAPSAHETAWGNPPVSAELFAAVYERGFRTLRLPTSWSCELSDDDFKIRGVWLDRVAELVDEALKLGFTVILNSHHDNDMYYPSAENRQRAEKYTRALWRQIAQRFAGYPPELVFESMNEPRLARTQFEWCGDRPDPLCVEARAILNELNGIFVDAVRGVPGNEKRLLMVTPYAASSGCALLDDFAIPTDCGDVAVSVHNYAPYNFAMNEHGTDVFDPENADDYSGVESWMRALHDKFVIHGTPVILGECGATNKNNDKSRASWAKLYTATAYVYDMPCVLWDNGLFGVGAENFGLIDRKTLEWRFPAVTDALFCGMRGE